MSFNKLSDLFVGLKIIGFLETDESVLISA